MDWLSDTSWEGIRSNAEVVNDFSYIGAHLNAKATCASKTVEKRWIKAGEQLKTLRFTHVEETMKIRTINTKVYATALYGIEAAQVAPDKIGKLTAAVVDAFSVKKQQPQCRQILHRPHER